MTAAIPVFKPVSQMQLAKELRRHLLFRDYLIKYSSEAHRYALLKRELAQKFASDRQAYTDAKSEYIQMITERALHDLRAI